MNWRGRLERKDLGTGVWVLHTDSGTVALYGDVGSDSKAINCPSPLARACLSRTSTASGSSNAED